MTEQNLLYIQKGFDRVVRSADELAETNDLTIGQVFHAIASFYKKTPDDYNRWISYEHDKTEFYVLKERIEESENDLEKVNVICEWLEEDLFEQ